MIEAQVPERPRQPMSKQLLGFARGEGILLRLKKHRRDEERCKG
jgi:hypothetical protein